ncbi:hypothetical protein ACQEU5_16385 [Marinactinospora thermotolerans]|uniref:hypothetical protein n=1 Tax=Marinactinospora thermotolerans TaxID=531310 RepID=UPI003D8F9C6E
MSAPTTPPTADTRPRPRVPRAVAGLATSMFLIVLTTAMIDLAEPAIREDLGLSTAELTLVVNGYLIAFAGLLLGGRLGAVTATSMALHDTGEGESGVLSGLVNAVQRLGGAIGLAALAGIAIGTAGTSGGIAFTTVLLGQSVLVLVSLVLALLPLSHPRMPPAAAGPSCPSITPSSNRPR